MREQDMIWSYEFLYVIKYFRFCVYKKKLTSSQVNAEK